MDKRGQICYSLGNPITFTMKYDIFHETLGAAVAHVAARLSEEQIVLCDETQLTGPFQYDGISYEQTKEAHAEIASIKGKGTRKYAHLIIYRMSSGRYEIVLYIF